MKNNRILFAALIGSLMALCPHNTHASQGDSFAERFGAQLPAGEKYLEAKKTASTITDKLTNKSGNPLELAREAGKAFVEFYENFTIAGGKEEVSQDTMSFNSPRIKIASMINTLLEASIEDPRVLDNFLTEATQQAANVTSQKMRESIQKTLYQDVVDQFKGIFSPKDTFINGFMRKIPLDKRASSFLKLESTLSSHLGENYPDLKKDLSSSTKNYENYLKSKGIQLDASGKYHTSQGDSVSERFAAQAAAGEKSSEAEETVGTITDKLIEKTGNPLDLARDAGKAFVEFYENFTIAEGEEEVSQDTMSFNSSMIKVGSMISKLLEVSIEDPRVLDNFITEATRQTSSVTSQKMRKSMQRRLYKDLIYQFKAIFSPEDTFINDFMWEIPLDKRASSFLKLKSTLSSHLGENYPDLKKDLSSSTRNYEDYLKKEGIQLDASDVQKEPKKTAGENRSPEEHAEVDNYTPFPKALIEVVIKGGIEKNNAQELVKFYKEISAAEKRFFSMTFMQIFEKEFLQRSSAEINSELFGVNNNYFDGNKPSQKEKDNYRREFGKLINLLNETKEIIPAVQREEFFIRLARVVEREIFGITTKKALEVGLMQLDQLKSVAGKGLSFDKIIENASKNIKFHLNVPKEYVTAFENMFSNFQDSITQHSEWSLTDAVKNNFKNIVEWFMKQVSLQRLALDTKINDIALDLGSNGRLRSSAKSRLSSFIAEYVEPDEGANYDAIAELLKKLNQRTDNFGLDLINEAVKTLLDLSPDKNSTSIFNDLVAAIKSGGALKGSELQLVNKIKDAFKEHARDALMNNPKNAMQILDTTTIHGTTSKGPSRAELRQFLDDTLGDVSDIAGQANRAQSGQAQADKGKTAADTKGRGSRAQTTPADGRPDSIVNTGPAAPDTGSAANPENGSNLTVGGSERTPSDRELQEAEDRNRMDEHDGIDTHGTTEERGKVGTGEHVIAK